MSAPSPREDEGCTRDEIQFYSTDEARAVVRDSKFDFEVAYVPSGLDLSHENATSCRGEATSSERVYVGKGDDDGRLLEIGRIERSPVIPGFTPEDRIKPLTINGRPSILIEPVLGDRATIIIMRDEGTLWQINGDEMTTDEVIKVAEGLK